MRAPTRLRGRVALVTGAAGGIGRAIATSLADRGTHLALVDIDEAGLAAVAAALATTGVRVSRHHVDVADRAAVGALPEAVEAAYGRLDILVNNAGVALAGTFAEASAAEFDRVLDVNFGGVVTMTRACLPMLHRSDDARIVNISSLFGLVAPPGQTAYAASKFAVRGFSEALRHELADSTVGVTIVYPGGVATRIARDARVAAGADPEMVARRKAAFAAALTLPPEVVGTAIVGAIERRRLRLVVGRDAKVAALLERLLPASHWSVLSRVAPRPR